MKRRPRLHLVGQDPGDVFNDLGKLRTDLAAPLRRQRIVETFARIPHDKALELYRHKIDRAAWVVLIELDRLVLKARGKNPVRFWSPRRNWAYPDASPAPTRGGWRDPGGTKGQRVKPVGGPSLVPVRELKCGTHANPSVASIPH